MCSSDLVIARLVERLFNLDYPRNKLNIYIIDDGSSDKTPLILDRLSKEFEKLKIISRSPNAGGGKSGALNYALKFTHGEWLLVLDADAQLKKDVTGRIESWMLVSDTVGSIVIDVKKDTFATYPDSLTSIVGSEYPRLSNEKKARDESLSTWSTQLTAGDILDFDVVSCNGIKKCSLFFLHLNPAWRS